MGLYEELLAELERHDDPASEASVEALRHEVAALRRMVARLAELLVAEGERPDAATMRRMLLAEALAPAEPPAEPPPPAFEGTPYRGTVPDRPGELRCRRCHRRLEADDPDLEGEDGRVCMACFQRGEA
jgi:hypothetical protein